MQLEMCKIIIFDYTIKWYIHKPEFVLENKTHKIHSDLKIQTEHLIPSTRPELKKRTCRIVDFTVDHKAKIKESEKSDKHFSFTREPWKQWNM